MSFEVDGFFSPEIERYREAVRSTAPFQAWFDYAHDLNKIGLDLLRTTTTARADNARFTMHGIFVRTHQSFQSALLLAERGIIGDARTVLRSGVEGAIAIRALAADPAFVERLIEAHYANKRKVARRLLDTPQYLATYAPSQVAEMHAAIAAVDAIEAANPEKRLREITWSNVALKHCPDLYELLYRSLSFDGTHTTLDSLDRFVTADANMKTTAFKAAPDVEGLVETLSMACLVFIWAAEPFAAATDRPDIAATLKEQLQRFATLPDAFPAAA